MTTYDMDSLTPVQTTVQRLPVPTSTPGDEDLPTVTVQGRFDWKFWAGVAVFGYAAYLLLKSMQRAAHHG